MAATAVLAVKHVGHEHSSATLISWALTSLAGDLAIVIDLQRGESLGWYGVQTLLCKMNSVWYGSLYDRLGKPDGTKKRNCSVHYKDL